MVLQRIQSVYLFLAAVLMILFFTMPTFDNTSLYASCVGLGSGIVMATLSVLSAVLCVIAIFSYHNLKKQAMICGVTLLVLIGLLVIAGIDAYKGYSLDCRLPQWASITLPIAIVMVWLARRGVIADKKVIESADRIR